MKIKYFIRGVGIGIIITTLILGISGRSKMSDEAIISKAKRLGMEFTDKPEVSSTEVPVVTEEPEVDNNENAENQGADKDSPQLQDNDSAQNSEQPVEGDSTQSDESAKPSGVSGTDTGNDNTVGTAVTETPPDNVQKKSSDKIVLVINRGDWSRKVAENLETLGLVDKPEEFDKYLVDKGYADRIRVGKFEINPDASFDEIARTITE